MKYAFVLFVFFSLCRGAQAYVIYSNSSVLPKSVVRLGSGEKKCSGTVVGLNPPTVISARHCSNAYGLNHVNPDKVIVEDYDSILFNPWEGEVPGDLAILIYPEELKYYLQSILGPEDVMKIGYPKLAPFQRILTCGFGYSDPSASGTEGLGTKRCGENNLIFRDKNLNFIKEIKSYQTTSDKSFGDLPPVMKTKFLHTAIQEHLSFYASGDRAAMGALSIGENKTGIGTYDSSHLNALINRGDSGGPLLVQTKEGLVLIGVNSVAMPSPDKSSIMVGALFWMIDNPWSKSFLQKAIDEGADIRGFSSN